MPNAYLAKLRQDYETQKAAIASLQQTALTEDGGIAHVTYQVMRQV